MPLCDRSVIVGAKVSPIRRRLRDTDRELVVSQVSAGWKVVGPGQVVPVGLVSDVTRCPGPVRDLPRQHTRPEDRAELGSTQNWLLG